MVTNEGFRNEVLLELKHVFRSEQLSIISDAMMSVMSSYSFTISETQLSTTVDYSYCKEADEFLLSKEFHGMQSGTIFTYRNLLNDYISYLHKDVKAATDDDIRGFLHSYQKMTGISNHTKENKRLILSSFYSWMHKKGKISVDPSVAVEPIKYTIKERKPLSDMEVEQMRFACESLFENALFEVFFSTGARVSEVVNMSLSSLNLETGEIKVLGKRNKERTVLLNPRAKFRLKLYLDSRTDDNDALFVSRGKNSGRLCKNTLEKAINQIGIRAGINRSVFPHLLRHTFACYMLRKTHGDVEFVSRMMGHTKIQTTQIYLHEDIEYDRQKYNMLISA